MKVTHAATLYSSYQRVIHDYLAGGSQQWFPGIGLTSMTRASLFGGTFQIVFLGTNLRLDQATNDVSGKVTKIKIFEVGVTEPVVTVAGVSFNLGNLVDRAGAVKKFATPKFLKFMDVMNDGVHTVVGSDKTDIMETTLSQDVLKGGKGNDRFIVNPVDPGDSANAKAAVDTVNGGAGKNDLLIVEKAAGLKGVKINLFLGSMKANFGAGFQKGLDIYDVENARGTNVRDQISGTGGKNKIWGAGGDDILWGLGGNDRINGGPGRDQILGGKGDDTLTGGPDPDYFTFNTLERSGTDTITDFNFLEDKIHFYDVDPDSVTVRTLSGDTIIDFPRGSVILENVTLTKSQIDFDYNVVVL